MHTCPQNVYLRALTQTMFHLCRQSLTIHAIVEDIHIQPQGLPCMCINVSHHST